MTRKSEYMTASPKGQCLIDYGKLIWLSLNFDETGFLIGKPGVLFPHGKSAL